MILWNMYWNIFVKINLKKTKCAFLQLQQNQVDLLIVIHAHLQILISVIEAFHDKYTWNIIEKCW